MSDRKSYRVEPGTLTQEDHRRVRMLRAKLVRVRGAYQLEAELNAVQEITAICTDAGQLELAERLCRP